MAASERAPATPSIVPLPNEILDRIFSYVPMHNAVHWTNNGRNRATNQAMLLMQVSRQFRKATQESRHWLDGNFYFGELITGGYDDDKRLRFPRFFNALLDDQYFASCLGRKTDWRFSSDSIGDLLPELAAARVPTFFPAVRKLALSQLLLEQQATWERLSGCRHVVDDD
jgi:hypothetical protein